MLMDISGRHRNDFIVARYGCVPGIPASNWGDARPVRDHLPSTAPMYLDTYVFAFVQDHRSAHRHRKPVRRDGELVFPDRRRTCISVENTPKLTTLFLSFNFIANPRIDGQRANLAPLSELHPRRRREQDLSDHGRHGQQQWVWARFYW